MQVTVLLFAKAREIAETSSTAVELPGSDARSSAVVEVLLQKWPQLEAIMRTSVLAVNQEYVDPESGAQIKDGDEVAIIPPLSGG
jgi:molybdopterin converting factor subunit 1